MHVQPYLFFDGRCEEAIEFYRQALDAKVSMLMRFRDSPVPNDPNMIPPGSENKIMHAAFSIGDTTLMASDGRCLGQPIFQGISLTINVEDAGKAKQLFDALSDGGSVQMPLTKTFYSPSFGMAADRFGVSWMILAAPSA